MKKDTAAERFTPAGIKRDLEKDLRMRLAQGHGGLFRDKVCKACKMIKPYIFPGPGICQECYNTLYYLKNRAHRIATNPDAASRSVTTMLRAVRDLRDGGWIDQLKAAAWESDALAVMHDVWISVGSELETLAALEERETEVESLLDEGKAESVDEHTINKVIEALRRKGLIESPPTPDEDQPALTEGSPQEPPPGNAEAGEAPPVESKPVEETPAA